MEINPYYNTVMQDDPRVDPLEKPAPIQFWRGVSFGAAAQALVTCGAVVAGAPDRMWVPAFIACGTMLCGHAVAVVERRRACQRNISPKRTPK